MNFKFFRPSREKIISFILIIILLIALAPFTLQKNVIGAIYIPVLFPAIMLESNNCAGDVCGGGIEGAVASIIVGIVYIYLISCIVVWLYNIKKRNR